MRLKPFKSLLTALVVLCTSQAAATTVAIPTTAGQYISWNDCTLTGANVENNGDNIGSTGASTVATFTIENSTQQDYILTFATGSKNEAKMKLTLTNTASSSVVLTKNVDIVNTGSWTPSTINNILLSQLPIGTYELKMAVTQATSYAGNWGKLAFYTTESFNRIPGTIGIASGGYAGGARLENNNTNVGWISNGTSASYSFICSEAGVYKMTIPMTRYGDGNITTTVTDDETGNEEANGTWTMTKPSNYEPTDVPIEGELTTGMKTLTMQFATTSSFLFNYKDFMMTRVGDHYSKISGVAISGQTVAKGDDSDWYCQLPAVYDATTTFSVTSPHGTVAATAEAITITDNGDGSFTLPTPAPGTTTTITLTLTPEAGAASSQTVYTLKLFRIGEISLTDVYVDGESIDVLSDINDNLTATYNNIYTAVPTVQVKVVDGTIVTAPAPTVNGTQATYAIHVEMAGKTKDYTLIINGLHIYEAGANDETVLLKYTAEGNDKTNNIWSNGLYSLSPIGDGWNNSGFKMKSNSTNTLTVPSDVVVKQFIIHQFSDNYAPGSFGTITSEGMTTTYIPAKHDFVNGSSYDLVINLDNHQAGKNIVFTLENGSQPTGWFELTIEKQAITTAPTLTDQQVTVVNNHAVVALTFDREMIVTTATINGSNVTAEGGSATLYFAVWGLDYSKEYTLAIAAGAAQDTYGNSNTAPIEITVSTSAKPVVEKVAYDYVVSTVDELKSAVAAVNSANNNASAARKTIFLKNGDYNMADAELRISGYNISLIGESRDGVIIRGQRAGISNPTLNLRDRTGFYLQDLTLLNDLNYYKPNQDKESTGGGVGVAVYGGDKTVMKNIRMLGAQDTQVTGHRAYFENCEIHGTVDFICGGGDNFYYRTDLVVERSSSCITAPSTSSTLKWGYVFQQCTIKGVHDGNTDSGYSLGRPWQDTPRSYYLNTTMNILPADNGWTGMGKLPTYFYEYNSMDGNGTPIDLTVRGNSPTSTNSYTPVLTDGEAAKFTVENVLGGTDSWLPTEQTVSTEAPAVSLSGNTLNWTEVADARCYVIFKDGMYLTNQTTTSYELTEEGVYTVRTANHCGGLGEVSASVVLKRSVKAGNWSTIVVPFAVNNVESSFGAGTKVARLTGVNGGVLSFESVNSMEANEPYLIQVAADFDAAVISEVTLYYGEPAKTVGNVTFQGVYESGLIPVGAYFVSSNTLYCAQDASNTIKPFRAYFMTTDGSRLQSFDIDGQTTGINSAMLNEESVKRNKSCYNLNGQRVAHLQKGLYIVNGKKVVIK